MASIGRLGFGYHPESLSISSGPISISALPGIASAKAGVESSETLDQDWISERPLFPAAVIERRSGRDRFQSSD
jgi:hypothetical protein